MMARRRTIADIRNTTLRRLAIVAWIALATPLLVLVAVLNALAEAWSTLRSQIVEMFDYSRSAVCRHWPRKTGGRA